MIARLTLIVCVVLAASCASAPPSLSPAAAQLWRANQAVVAIGQLQSAAISLNKIEMCDGIGPDQRPACRPLVSDRNTRIVIDACGAAVKTIGYIPEGWRPATLAAIDQIEALLDKPGQAALKVYLATARAVLLAIPTGQPSGVGKLVPRFGG